MKDKIMINQYNPDQLDIERIEILVKPGDIVCYVTNPQLCIVAKIEDNRVYYYEIISYKGHFVLGDISSYHIADYRDHYQNDREFILVGHLTPGLIEKLLGR